MCRASISRDQRERRYPGEAIGVAVAGSYAYVADGQSGLQVIDVSNPAAPAITGTVDTPEDASGVAVAGSYAYEADCASGLQVIDVSNPAAPAIEGALIRRAVPRGVAVAGSAPM